MVRTVVRTRNFHHTGAWIQPLVRELRSDKPWLSQNKNEKLIRKRRGFPGGSVSKESDCTAGDLGSIPGSGRSPGEGNGNPLQCSGLENSMDFVVYGVTKSRTQLNN